MTATDTPVNNGVNVEALLGAREALTSAPDAAKFEWRATSEWQNGTHSNSIVEGFFGLGDEQKHRTRDPGRVHPRRPGRLPHGRCRGRRPEP